MERLPETSQVPPWIYAEWAEELGFAGAKDSAWHYVGRVAVIASKPKMEYEACCFCRGVRSQSDGGDLGEPYVFVRMRRLICEERREFLYLGRCEKCGQIFWGRTLFTDIPVLNAPRRD